MIRREDDHPSIPTTQPRQRKPTAILVLLVNGLGLLIFLGWLAWGLVSLHSGLIGLAGIGVRVITPAVLLLGLAAAWRAGRDARLVAALCLFAWVASLYLAEAFLEVTIDQGKARQENHDRRSKIEVIADFRKQGIDAYPVMRAKTLLMPNGPSGLSSVLGADDFLPLASLPNRQVVSCNESGKWLTYDSDRHGFNNPDDVWTGEAPSIVLLGDSFTHGSCVNSKDNIAGRLRKSAGKVINLGVSGFGPLSMLAALSEYAEPLRPQYVLWLFFEGNDLTDDLPFERQAPILTSYLERPDFRQNLINRGPELERRLKAYLDAQLGEAMARFDNPHEKILDFLQLFHLRERFGLGLLSIGFADTENFDEQVGYFRRVLQKARDQTKGWGGRLIVVYLPESARYFAAAQNGDLRRRMREAVLTSTGNLDIPLIDMAAEFQKDKNPASFFVYPGSHYNEAGYGLTAKAIEAYLQAMKKAR